MKDTRLDHTFTILVADDDPANREMVEAVLSTYGCAIVTTGDGLSAWQTVMSEPVDLVIIDLNMPGLTGYDFIARARANRDLSDLPILVMSSAEDDTACERAFSVGASAYLFKPMKWPMLTHEVWTALKNLARDNELRSLKARLGINTTVPVELAAY